ncbi:lipid-A-disaccharide synthase N-terminal domain-containing protein [Algoriphagus sp.]|uniref:lipid-A-disaccharide synthase N-terminal domain-containing protein n=1 Tax=Algoriphagus sp. TaxID=1872435 RepID=UPI0025E29FD8|nr:lipid-A-disaccharide synthase N-terminal domain-containing protein [Algoriphagus sp.]
MSSWWLLGVGFLAQGLFSARFLIQLIKSEKAGEVLSPVIFWQLSLIASFLLMIYGTFREDAVIVGGQVIGYYIYIRNLQIQNSWKKFGLFLRVLFLVLPFVFFIYLIFFNHLDLDRLFDNPEISSLMLTWGGLGQVVFTTRFVVQWFQSEKTKNSHFPMAFWYISMVGAVMIATYAIFRNDAVLFIGQAFGILVYGRNIMIHFGPRNTQRVSVIERIKEYRLGLLLILTAMVLFFNLNAWSVTESSEARYAEIGKEMLESGDWIHPQLMGIYHYHKPPMTYWITATSYKIFGVSPFAARFFLQISILLEIFLVYLIGKLLVKDKKKAFLAAMLYASFPTVIISGRALTTDAFLTTFILAGIFFWIWYETNSKPWVLLLAYVFLGLGFLTKGPVDLIVPLVLLASQKIHRKRIPGSVTLHLIGWILMLSIGLSWFVKLYTEDPRFFDYFVFKHTVDRFATDTFGRSQPFWFYPVLLILTAFPWVLIFLAKSKSIWKSHKSLPKFFWVWLIVPVIFFSLSHSKLVLYILPVYSGLALGAVVIWGKLKKQEQKLWERIQLGIHIFLLIALLLSPLIDERIALNYKFYFLAIIIGSVLVAFQFTGMRRADRAIVSAWIFTMGITGLSTYFFSQNPGLTNDPRRVVSWIGENTPTESRLIIYDKRLPSVLFLSDRNVMSIYDGDESLNRETQFQKDDQWKSFLINLKKDPNWINDPKNQAGIWLARKNKEMPELPSSKSWEVLKELDGWKILKIIQNQ